MSRARKIEKNSCAILLAAGSGSRFHASPAAVPAAPGAPTHKLVAILRGKPVYQWAVEAVLGAGLAHLVVVTGAVELDLPETVLRVHNPHWSEGQATSLQCGLAAARTLKVSAAVVGLGDQPFITPTAWRRVAEAPADIAVATYDGIRGNPVLLHRRIWPLLPSIGDHGARSLIALRPELVVDVACDGSPADIDTMEDLQQWNSSTNSPSTDPSTRPGRC